MRSVKEMSSVASQIQLVKIIGVMVIIYLAILLGIARYLKAKHETVWLQLGSPSLLNWSIMSSSRLGSYVFLSGRHRNLHDGNLSSAIYFARAWVVIAFATIAVWKLQ